MLIKYPSSVAHAAQIFDVIYPGWAKKINVGKLNMASGKDCILGQLYGSFNHRWELFDGNGLDTNLFSRISRKDEWIKEINDRMPKQQRDSKGRFVSLTNQHCTV